MATKTRRKTSTAMVFNPSRSLAIGGSRTVNPRRRRRRRTVKRRTTSYARRRRRNPATPIVARRRRNPIRRRRNPSTASGLLVAAVMAGIGVSIFDLAAQRFAPSQSVMMRAGVKLGGAFLMQSRYGSKIPVLGKYKNDIALVLAVAGVVDLMKLYVFPLVSQVAGNVGGMIALPGGDDTTGNIYGNAYADSWPGAFA